MNSFAVSMCLLEKIDTDDRVLQDVLIRLSDSVKPRKVVVDEKGIVLSWYKSHAESSKSQRLAVWLFLLGTSTSNYDHIKLDLSTEEPSISTFLKIASEVKTQKQLIVYDFNGISDEIQNGNVVQVNNKWVKVLDVDEAICKFRNEDGGTTISIHQEKPTFMRDKYTDKSKTEHYENSAVQKGDGTMKNVGINKSPGSIRLIAIGAAGAIIAGIVLYYLFGR